MINTFRFDDVCLNTDRERLVHMTSLVRDAWPTARILWALSPLVARPDKTPPVKSQRIYTKMLAAHSDYRRFYDDVDLAGVVEDAPPSLRVTRAAHGLIHVDHRVLPVGAQEMSMLVSCALAKAHVFVPPKNMWTPHMERVALDNDIELIKFERGWLAAEHNRVSPPKHQSLWYTHDWAWDTVEQFAHWVEDAR